MTDRKLRVVLNVPEIAVRLRRESGADSIFDHGFMFRKLVGAAFRIVNAQARVTPPPSAAARRARARAPAAR